MLLLSYKVRKSFILLFFLFEEPFHEAGFGIAAGAADLSATAFVAMNKAIGNTMIAVFPRSEFKVTLESFHFLHDFDDAVIGADAVFIAVKSPDGNILNELGLDKGLG